MSDGAGTRSCIKTTGSEDSKPGSSDDEDDLLGVAALGEEDNQPLEGEIDSELLPPVTPPKVPVSSITGTVYSMEGHHCVHK